MSERLEKIIPQLLTKIDFKEGMRNFKKKYYEDFFKEYRNRTEEVNKEIVAMYDSADKDEEMQSAALALISYAKSEYEKAGMFKKSTKLMDMQCMMVFYVLPSLLSNGHPDDDRIFADTVTGQWRAAFPKSQISAAPYEDIYNRLRSTIFEFNIDNIYKKNYKVSMLYFWYRHMEDIHKI